MAKRPARSPNIEGHLDGLIELLRFRSVTRSHAPSQTIAWHGEDIVEIGNTWDRKPLSTAQDNFRWKSAYRSSDEGYDHGANRVEDGIPGQDHDRPVPNR